MKIKIDSWHGFDIAVILTIINLLALFKGMKGNRNILLSDIPIFMWVVCFAWIILWFCANVRFKMDKKEADN